MIVSQTMDFKIDLIMIAKMTKRTHFPLHQKNSLTALTPTASTRYAAIAHRAKSDLGTPKNEQTNPFPRISLRTTTIH